MDVFAIISVSVKIEIKAAKNTPVKNILIFLIGGMEI